MLWRRKQVCDSGHSVTVIASLKAEIVRLEEIKRANIEKFIINIRDELNVLWDDCFYSEEQRLDQPSFYSPSFLPSSIHPSPL